MLQENAHLPKERYNALAFFVESFFLLRSRFVGPILNFSLRFVMIEDRWPSYQVTRAQWTYDVRLENVLDGPSSDSPVTPWLLYEEFLDIQNRLPPELQYVVGPPRNGLCPTRDRFVKGWIKETVIRKHISRKVRQLLWSIYMNIITNEGPAMSQKSYRGVLFQYSPKFVLATRLEMHPSYYVKEYMPNGLILALQTYVEDCRLYRKGFKRELLTGLKTVFNYL